MSIQRQFERAQPDRPRYVTKKGTPHRHVRPLIIDGAPVAYNGKPVEYHATKGFRRT